MKDFNVIADGAAYIHRAEHLPEVGKDIDLGDGLQATVDEIRQPDLPNPVIRAWNVRPHDADQVFTAEVEALGLGYTLVIVGLPRGGLESHVAGASRQGGSARMLACGHSAGETRRAWHRDPAGNCQKRGSLAGRSYTEGVASARTRLMK
jgi:hypothetical protein